MAIQVFENIGIQQPTDIAIPGTATVIRARNDSGGNFSRGNTVRLIPSGGYDAATDLTENDINQMDDFDMEAPAVPSADQNEAQASLTARIHALLLEDIADGASGVVLLRGYGMALLEVNSGTTIIDDAALYAGEGTTSDNLRYVADMTTQSAAKILAYSRLGSGNTVVDGDGEVLRPVLFNGVEGFGIIQGVA